MMNAQPIPNPLAALPVLPLQGGQMNSDIAREPRRLPAPIAGRPLPSLLRSRREALRARWLSGDLEGLPDAELLELMLARVLPRQDVAGLAQHLLQRFGDIAAVCRASPRELEQVAGLSRAVQLELRLTEALAIRLTRARIVERPLISCWSALIDYCRSLMAHRDVEHFRVMFLDRKNRLIADEELARGTVDHVPVYPREILRRALEFHASALILVHNHPSGDPEPSETDIEMTRRVAQAASALGIELHDHIVVGSGREASLRALGHL